MIQSALTVVAVALLLTGCAPTAVTAPTALTAPPVTASAVARVYAMDFGKAEPAQGSGFFVGNGQLITTRHVIGGRTPLGIVTSDGRRQVITETVADDVGSELTLLRVEGTGQVLRLSERTPATGDQVSVITVCGVKRVTVRAPVEDSQVGPVLTFDREGFGEGDSGAPVIDARGEVVGVVRGEIEGRAEAVPARWIRELLKGLEAATWQSGSGVR